MTALEAQAPTNLLREYELRLLRCSIPPPSPPSYHQSCNSLHKLIDDVLSSVEAGDYAGALSSDAIRTVFKSPESTSLPSVDNPDFFYSDVVLKCVDSFVLENEEEKDYRAFLVMSIAVAALLAFTQRNVTGPIEKLPASPLSAIGYGGENAEWEGWARNELMSAGSDLLGKFYNLQYIVFSKIMLVKLKDLSSEGKVFSMDQMRSLPWWLARLLLLQQRVLDERSSSLFDLLQVYSHEALRCFGTSQSVATYWGSMLQKEEASTIISMLYLEVGIMEHAYARVDSSRLHFESAEVASGLQLFVTGALGFRTIHQVEPKAQRLLVAKTSASNDSVDLPSATPELQENASSDGGNKFTPRQETDQTSDVLMTPKFIKDDKCSEKGVNDHVKTGNEAAPLRAIHQAVILAQCLYIEKSTAHDEMQRWEMAPYIEAIDSQASSDFIIRYFCDILRVRWESTRSRTKERALMMMEKVVQSIYDSSPTVAKRMNSFFGVYVSSIPALRKEYGELLVSCGLIGEAVTTFEDLELWDNLILCYRLLGKKAAAVELINKRLSEMPNDPRLWCSLGDVTNDDSCFEKALEVSDNRSARAKRSLARSAYNRGDYEKSKILWESAMALNSLYPDGWFALGAAALKARDADKALDAFTSAVQLDPDNGEAWNNIACLHMIKKKNKEAFIAFKEALKFKRNSWQLWENFSHVAADVGNFGQALQATQMVLDLSSNKRSDAQFLERIMLELEGRFIRHSQSDGASNSPNNDVEIHPVDPANSEVCSAETRETDSLMELLGKILQKIVRNTGEGDIWGLYARWHKLKGDLTMCSEAFLKQVRSYQGSDLWKEMDRFKKFASASLELCKVYMELSSSTGSRKELHAAEMHLKSTIKQAGNFSDSQELRDLEACLVEVQKKLQETNL